MLGNIMPPTLEKKKYKAKKNLREPIKSEKSGFKQKQKQQQTVIVNFNKQKRSSVPRSNGIEKPKEQPKEQPKTYNSFSFSMPQAQNPIGEYLKVFNKDLFSKIEQAIKTKDSVINSSDEAIKPIIAVKSPERIPTPLEFITPPKSLENTLKKIYLRKQEDQTPLTIGKTTDLEDVTTLDDPQNILLDESEPAPEPAPEEITKDTVETLKKVDESPDLSKEIKRGRGPDKNIRKRRTKDQILLDENRKLGSLETRRDEYVRDGRINPPYSPSSLNLGSRILGTNI